MLSAINTALSGLNAASTQLDVSANNIANQFSTQTNVNGKIINQPYQPKQVDQVTLSSGGLQALVNNVNPATVAVANPSSPTGTSQLLPNVNPVQEAVNQITASQSFQANFNTIKTANKMLQSLLDIQA